MIAVIIFGFVFGFVGAIPVAGPIAAMVVERSIIGRFRAAIWLAIGSAIAEGGYAALAVFGFSFLVDYEWVDPASKLVAGIILIGLGLVFAFKPPVQEGDSGDTRRAADTWFGQMMLGFGITAANPTLMATWTVATSMLHASGWAELTPLTGIPFGLMVAVGAASWFVIMVAIIKRVRGRFKTESLQRFVQAMGWLLVGLGVWFTVLFVKYMVAN